VLHHVEIYVPDLGESLEFWGWLLPRLGYSQYQDWPAGRSYKQGDTYIVFVQSEYDDPGFDRRAPGLNHLAFHADSRADVDLLGEELRPRGIRILYEDQHPDPTSDYYALFFEDPMGLKVEVVAR
jgi:catechol 2,3-dioxygenase-like lactoylglutathione lyase family enzyme